jgi:signal transduction histidine kinase
MIATLLLVAGVLSLLSLLVIRGERGRRSVLLEYEAERLAGSLLDSYRDGSLPARLADTTILGFGVYSFQGDPLVRFGTAPPTLVPDGLPIARAGLRNDAARREATLVRPIGGAVMQRSMSGVQAGRFQGPRGPMPGHMTPEAGTAAFLFLELPTEEYSRSERAYRVATYAAPLAIALLAALAGSLYWKNADYRKRMAAREQLARLGEVARTLAHEIRNPLAAIRMQTGILRRALPADDRPEITAIEAEVARLTLLSDRIGTFLRDPRGTPQPVGVVAFLQDLVAGFGGRVKLTAHPDLDDAAILFDPDRLRSVLENLIANALESGTIEPPEVIASADDAQVEIAVLDRGAGIPSDDSERVFDPFFTCKTRGSGVGLAIARRFADAVGARIRLEPRPDGGTSAQLLAKRVPA